MKNVMMCGSVFGLLAAGVLLGGAMMQEADHPSDQSTDKQASAMSADMMKARQFYAEPGPGQDRLAQRVGTWNVTLRYWPAPGKPAEEAKGTSRYKMTMGGRFLEQEYQSEWNGTKFVGWGLSGHNNKTEKYQFTWIDNMATGMMQGTGVFDGDTLKWTGIGTDPLKGAMPIRGTETFDGTDHFVATMYTNGPDGAEFKMMELTYDRANGDH